MGCEGGQREVAFCTYWGRKLEAWGAAKDNEWVSRAIQRASTQETVPALLVSVQLIGLLFR